ncbi:LysR substrate-binding domain-containing protein, partial [Xanthomonas perforans]
VRGTTVPPMHTFNDSTDAMRAAVYGLGAVLARKHIAQPYLQRYELVRLPGPTLKARYAYYIVHPSHRELSPAAALFIDWLKREAQDERTPMPALPAELVALPLSEGVQEPRARRRLRSASAAE